MDVSKLCYDEIESDDQAKEYLISDEEEEEGEGKENINEAILRKALTFFKLEEPTNYLQQVLSVLKKDSEISKYLNSQEEEINQLRSELAFIKETLNKKSPFSFEGLFSLSVIDENEHIIEKSLEILQETIYDEDTMKAGIFILPPSKVDNMDIIVENIQLADTLFTRETENSFSSEVKRSIAAMYYNVYYRKLSPEAKKWLLDVKSNGTQSEKHNFMMKLGKRARILIAIFNEGGLAILPIFGCRILGTLPSKGFSIIYENLHKQKKNDLCKRIISFQPHPSITNNLIHLVDTLVKENKKRRNKVIAEQQLVLTSYKKPKLAIKPDENPQKPMHTN